MCFVAYKTISKLELMMLTTMFLLVQKTRHLLPKFSLHKNVLNNKNFINCNSVTAISSNYLLALAHF
jgi:hypothetical protein